MIDAGQVCAAYHDETVRDVKTRRVQCDEIWSFCYAKAKNVSRAKRAPEGAGDVWTWTGIDSDSKMILAYEIGDRSSDTAIDFMDDLRARLADRVQLTTDGHKAYLEAVEGAFGGDIDYAQLVKLYGGSTEQRGHEKKYSPAECIGIKTTIVEGDPDPKHISTSYVERQKPHDADGHASVHATDKWFLEKAAEPSSYVEPVLLALQLLPNPQDAEGHACNGGWTNERAARHGMDRQPDRRAGTEAESSGGLPQAADFKLRHYRDFR